MPKGTAWDTAYIDHEVQYHQQLLATATAGLNAAQNQDLKDLLGKDAQPRYDFIMSKADQASDEDLDV